MRKQMKAKATKSEVIFPKIPTKVRRSNTQGDIYVQNPMKKRDIHSTWELKQPDDMEESK